MFNFFKKKKPTQAAETDVENKVIETPIETEKVAAEPQDSSASEEVEVGVEESPASEKIEVEVEESLTNEKAVVESENLPPTQELPVAEPIDSPTSTTDDIPTEVKQAPGFFASLASRLSRTKQNIGSGFVNLFRGRKIDEDLYEDLETQLLVADVGMKTTQDIITHLTKTADKSTLREADALYDELKKYMSSLLDEVQAPLDVEKCDGPFVILMVGVNGVGKTTTIGKMAKQFQAEGKKVMLAAGDTFRAAAVEQLQVWGERNDIPVVAQHTGADSASVLFDALQSAAAKDIDILIADTAGRLQNKDHLMAELEKVVRVMKKVNPDAPHEVMLTLDAGTGQNAISQAKLFNEAVGITGITLSKLDGTAKGGVIFPIAAELQIPIRFIGVGEGIDDLRPFDSTEFISALFTQEDDA
jgi:fused signal recognition particle receptor